jgi:hypothetical protein
MNQRTYWNTRVIVNGRDGIAPRIDAPGTGYTVVNYDDGTTATEMLENVKFAEEVEA